MGLNADNTVATSTNNETPFLIGVKVNKGDKVEDVVKNMSEKEALVIRLFDYNKNGVFDKREPEVLNASIFENLEDGIKITLDKFDTKVTIKYSDKADLEHTRLGKEALIIPFSYTSLRIKDRNFTSFDYNEKGLGEYDIEKGVKEIELDYTNKSVKVEGSGINAYEGVKSDAEYFEINNYSCGILSLHDKVKLAKLNNVKSPGFFGDIVKTVVIKHGSQTQIEQSGNTKISIDVPQETPSEEETKL